MESNTRIQLPTVTHYQKEFIIKALNYYKLSSVEFTYDCDEIVFNSALIIDIIEEFSKIVSNND